MSVKVDNGSNDLADITLVWNYWNLIYFPSANGYACDTIYCHNNIWLLDEVHGKLESLPLRKIYSRFLTFHSSNTDYWHNYFIICSNTDVEYYL